MKTPKNNEFPSLPRFVVYMAVIAVFCLINCLTVEAKDRMGDPHTKGNYGIMNVNLPVVKCNFQQWLFEVYLKVVLQPINDQPADDASGYLIEIARTNELTGFRNLSTGTTIVMPPMDKSSE